MTQSLNYIEAKFVLEPLDPTREILMAELAETGFESFEFTENGLTGWIPSDQFTPESLQEVIDKYAHLFSIACEHAPVQPVNWNEEWEKHYEPVVINNQCSIRAPFHAPRHDLPFDLVIEPKMSFGTAHHDTTALMIQWILEMDITGLHVLDMGCGTGVLGILAAQKGAAKVIAIDNYIWACENTRENCERNRVNNMITVHGDADALKEINKPFDLVLANINRNVILEDMKAYTDSLVPGGTILFSGFLADDAHLIRKEALQHHLRFDGEKLQNQWVSQKFLKEKQ